MGALPDERQRADHALPGVEVVGWLVLTANLLSHIQLRFDCCDHTLGNLVLDGENVSEIAVVALGPDMVTGFSLDQLGGDTDAVAGFAHTAFEHITHPQLAPDLLYINGAALVGEGAVA